MGAPQSSELGFGGLGRLALELPLAKAIGVQGEVGGLVLSDGDPPQNPRFVDRSAGTAGLLMAGLRVHVPHTGLWADADLGGVLSGSVRFGFDAHLGWDFALDRRGHFALGPVAGYTHVLQPDDAIRPEDARIVSLGLQLSFGKTVQSCPDRDGDGACDAIDACPTQPGIRTDDPRSDGCPVLSEPPPPVAPLPERDRDHDAIVDKVDACPDTPGVASADPQKNGCPRSDRDNDDVFDEDDACPDVPGLPSNNPKTNGCPLASGPVRMEGDRIILDEVIHFELDSPRVRRVSWGLIEQVAKFINANPDILEIDIEGHADRLGTDEHNMKLSKERAEAVQRFLVKYGVATTRVTARGFGESRPISKSRAPVSELSQDRRVEFWVVRARPLDKHRDDAGAQP